MLFLIEYDRAAGRIVSLRRFAANELNEANKVSLDLEIGLWQRGEAHEVVMLDAASEEDLRKTHRRYFESLETLAAVP